MKTDPNNKKTLIIGLLFLSIVVICSFGTNCVTAANSTNLTTVRSAHVNMYGLSSAQITDGQIRAEKYYNLHNKLPNYISYGAKKVPIANFKQILTAKGLKLVYTNQNKWVKIKNLRYYHQTTQYTCGPSSLKMVLSNYGMTLSEMKLANYAGTKYYTGSTENGMINAVNKVNKKYGKHYRSYKESLSSEGWNGLYSYISLNYPVTLHIRSFLHPNSGHFVVLTGINLKLKRVIIADPNYGYRTLTFSQISSRINWIVSTGRSSTPLLFVTPS